MSEPRPRRKRQSKSAGRVKVSYLSEQQLRDAAYYLWEQEGRPEGRALDHWLQASAQHGKAVPASTGQG